MSGAEILKGGVPGGNGVGVGDGRVDGLAVLDSYHSDKCSLYNGDSCEIIKGIPDNSVHLQVYSPPFGTLYIYSSSERDMGNANDDGEFAEHFRYLVPELLRITIPGRLMCVHCKDLPLYWGRDGAAGLKDFPGDLIRIFTSCGWTYHSRITIWKDPVTEMERTKNHGLLYKSLCADSCNGRQGMADYVLVFRKWNDEKLFVNPVLSEDGDPERFRIGEYVGTNPPADYEGRRDFSIQVWRKYASPVWFDIDQMDVLNYRGGKGSTDERHICIARDSLVLTEDGYIPIQDVQVGANVLTYKGRWRPVTAKACNGVKPIIRIEAQGVADLLTTPDHLLWTRQCVGRGGKGWEPGTMSPWNQRKNAMTAIPDWVQAQDTLGSYINLQLPPIEESPYTPDEWWIVGRWLGDGHFDVRGHAHISCGHHESEELVSLMGSRAGAVTKVRTGYQIWVNDREGRLRALLRRCGHGAKGKRLPVEAVSLDSKKAESLLAGYLSADGHYVAKYQRWTASSVSRPLLLGMAMVAQRARGVVASVYAGRPPGVTKIEGRTVKTSQDWILSIPPRNISAMLLDDGAWKKVRKIEPVGSAEVWDIQVEEDESFTVEGCVVHNCPLQLGVIRRCIHLWSNPGDVVFTPFAGVGSEPVVAVEMGRKAIGIELKDSYFSHAVRRIKIAESESGRPKFGFMEDEKGVK